MRAHGVRGEVVIDALTNRDERFAPGSVLYVDDRRMVVEAGRRHQGRWLISFGGVIDRTTAERLRGALVTGDPLGDLPEDEYWMHELIGRTVRVATGDDASAGDVAGVIVAVEVNPASDLLVLDNGHLVPSRFITEITPDVVVVDVPAGLFEI